MYYLSEAPDSLDNLIKKLTCYPLAQAVVYHCCRENDEVEAKIGRYGNGYVGFLSIITF